MYIYIDTNLPETPVKWVCMKIGSLNSNRIPLIPVGYCNFPYLNGNLEDIPDVQIYILVVNHQPVGLQQRLQESTCLIYWKGVESGDG